jgi:hypothetical protein
MNAGIKEVTVHNHKSKIAKTALKWCAAAAAAALFFTGGIAYAAKYGITRTNPGWESGYQVDITSRRVTEAEFSEEIRAVKQELLEDIATMEDAENREVFGWIKDFDTVEETVNFIGHEGLKMPSFPGTLEQTGAVVLGNSNADILYTESFARYSYDGNWATMSCRMYTDTFSYATGGGIKEDGLQYVDETYITANGKEAFLVFPTEYAGNHGIQGYLVDNSKIYELWISGYEKDTDYIIQLMKDWLDQL